MSIQDPTACDVAALDRSRRHNGPDLSFADLSALSWQDDAPCGQVDPELFFPETGGSSSAAKRICAGCPVRVKCLEYALVNNVQFGVWGGTSERERRRIRLAAASEQPGEAAA